MFGRGSLSEIVAGLCEEEFEELLLAVSERKCREQIGYGTFAEASDLYVTDPTCPRCGSADVVLNGRTRTGVRRYLCKSCDRGFGALTGTALDGMRCDFPTLVGFVRLMRSDAPLDAIAESCGITHAQAWDWRHRVFSSVADYQDRIILRDRVWIDEMFLSDTDLTPLRRGKKKQGLSKEKACVFVAIDVHKNVVLRREGNGKPSSARTLKALGGNIAKGSTLVGDKERAHNALARQVGGPHLTFKADPSNEEYRSNLAMVNQLCSWVRRYLSRHTGMDMKYLQDYLNWYAYLFRVNQARKKWPPTQRIIRHLMLTRVTKPGGST